MDKCEISMNLDDSHRFSDGETLYVIIVVSNPVEYKRRYVLFEEFKKRYTNYKNVKIYAAELQQGIKPFETSAEYKFRSNHEIWFKENLINLVVQRLPSDWKYFAWIDADIMFINENWPRETIHALQHYKVVQMFTNSIDLGPKGEVIKTFDGFAYLYNKNGSYKHHKQGYKYGHPGYAWAITRRAYNKIGSLIDFAILGSADYHMALGFVEESQYGINSNLHPNYKLLINNFQDRCKDYIKKNIGYINGTIIHYWHGKKKDRQYQDRWKILINYKFDPMKDIFRDGQGLYQLTSNKIQMRDAIKKYFRARNEDSIDI